MWVVRCDKYYSFFVVFWQGIESQGFLICSGGLGNWSIPDKAGQGERLKTMKTTGD